MTHSDSPGIKLLDEERTRAIEKGYTVDHDRIQHGAEELLRIAACYLDAASSDMEGTDYDWPHPFWPDDSMIPPDKLDSPLEMAVRGGQFLAAALDVIWHESGMPRG